MEWTGLCMCGPLSLWGGRPFFLLMDIGSLFKDGGRLYSIDSYRDPMVVFDSTLGSMDGHNYLILFFFW